MTQLPPAWWPAVVTATRNRRAFAALLLDRCTPTWAGATLQLAFTDPVDARAWTDSGCSVALGAALQQCGIHADVTVTSGPQADA